AAIYGIWIKDASGRLLGLEELAHTDQVQLKGEQVQFTAPNAELIIAMDLGDKSLEDRLRECRADGQYGIPVVELLEYMEAAAKAIDYLNQPYDELNQPLLTQMKFTRKSSPPSPIIHCDIKPANILIVGGSIKICDFGLLKPYENFETAQSTGGIV